MDSATGETKLSPVVEEEELFSYAMALVSGSVPVMTLKAIIELNVLEIIKRAGPEAYLSPAEIAAKLPASIPDSAAVMLDRMLCLLASYSVVTCSLRMLPDGRAERLYRLAPVGKFLTKNEDGVSLATISLMVQDRAYLESWHYMKEAVLEGGIAFNKAHETTMFGLNEANPRLSKVFNAAMSDLSMLEIKKILEAYKGFEGLSSLVDVGGGIGTTLNMIVSKYPMIKGINFDLPHVIKDSPPFPGVQHVGGDMFVNIPKGDAIITKRVLLNWSNEHCIKLLKNCYASLPNHGKVIACESILPTAVETTAAAKVVSHLDLIMLSYFAKGKERSENEFEGLAKAAGFQGFRVVCSAYHIKVMEFLKKN
ncbi:hypothetical protein Nepgr_023719 [Nepenthes gracilis]|uniref:Caffeic acid 3-O-methyltransferase n=1 Tax=Nepenthes gracilis TaxID=150966 RepID=A0AAD3T4R3_NEPGR|nr:hypothetical protein Nepgr_023719 [Nepenthes gracilis]